MKIHLTIGIPTYNRSNHLDDRLDDLKRLGYFNHPEVEIIVHDNDSHIKSHCLKIKELKRRVTNIHLIESSPNIGMVKACYKIIVSAKGKWISLLGDDDPIIMKCSRFLNLIKKSKNSDHFYLAPKVFEKGKISLIPWIPMLKVGSYDPSLICAKVGFTTGFAFLGAHAFRNQQNLPKLWLKAHKTCLFYGHCKMFLDHYKNSFYTREPLAAWRSGNERVSIDMNTMRHLELRNLFKYPPSKGIRKLLHLRPWEVVRHGKFQLINHIEHEKVEFINKNERLCKNERIVLKDVKTMLFNKKGNVYIDSPKSYKREDACCVFSRRRNPKNKSEAALFFKCGRSARLESMLEIFNHLLLEGKIIYKERNLSLLELLAEHCRKHGNRGLWRLQAFAIIMLSVVLYGLDGFNLAKIINNYFNRPKKGLYKILRISEKTLRMKLLRWLTSRKYYKLKKTLFGVRHFSNKRPKRSELFQTSLK
jgi:glycosyltransferase involved in cell wall biosynthesis